MKYILHEIECPYWNQAWLNNTKCKHKRIVCLVCIIFIICVLSVYLSTEL